MNNDYRIHLNFLPVVGSLPQFRVYRKPRGDSERRPDEETVSYSFPKAGNPDDRAFFWVKSTPADGYEPYSAAG